MTVVKNHFSGVFLTKKFTHTPSVKVNNKTLIHFSDKNKFRK